MLNVNGPDSVLLSYLVVARVTRGWDSALQAAQTTLTLVKTPASSSQKSSLEERPPRTAG